MKSMRKLLSLLLFTLLSVTLFACTEQPNSILPINDEVGQFSDYDQLEQYLASFYEKRNNDYYYYRNVDSALESDGPAMTTMMTTTTMANPSSPSDEQSDPDYSKTNNQVDGVIEMDRVLTDGYYLYLVSEFKFTIVDAETLEIVYAYETDTNYLQGLYVYNDTVVVIGNEYSYEDVSPEIYDYYYRYSYGVRVNVFNISDMENVTLSKTLYFENSYLVNSRMIEGQLYLIMDNYTINYGYLEDSFVPKYIDSTISDDFTLIPADHIFFMPNDYERFGYLLLASVDVETDEAADVKAYLGSSYQIYMSLQNLYTIVYRYNYDVETETYTHETFILRFEIVEGKLVYQAMGKVSGSPLNQFSMDEYDGVFRIATTGYEYTATDWIVSNQLYLLDATTSGEMDLISTLSGLGKPGERIYAVRFSNEIAYVVTFVQTDPLYKLDLSDPTHPEILGELYEEGVSDYLHEIGPNLMVGIGRQAKTENGFTFFTGVKISLYDTSGNTPLTLETYLVEGTYSYTNVMWDHKAFVSFTPENADYTIIAVPIYEYFNHYYQYSQSMYVFKVYHSGDLELVSKLTHFDEEDQNYWYFDSIDRAVIINQYVYTISYTKIQMYDMLNGFEIVHSLEYNTRDYYYYPVDDSEEPVEDGSETVTTTIAETDK